MEKLQLHKHSDRSKSNVLWLSICDFKLAPSHIVMTCFTGFFTYGNRSEWKMLNFPFARLTL